MKITKSPKTLSFAVLFVSALCLQVAHGQRSVPLMESGMPVPPMGLDGRALPEKSMVFETAEEQGIRVVVMGEGLTYPWALEFLPDGSLLVTERTGNLRIIRNGVLDPQPVPGGPEAVVRGPSGAGGSVHGYTFPPRRGLETPTGALAWPRRSPSGPPRISCSWGCCSMDFVAVLSSTLSGRVANSMSWRCPPGPSSSS